MEDYCESIAQRFSEMYGNRPKGSRHGFTKDIRIADVAKAEDKDVKQVQGVNGMILWAARWTRFDAGLQKAVKKYKMFVSEEGVPREDKDTIPRYFSNLSVDEIEKKLIDISKATEAGGKLQCSTKCMKSKKKADCHRHAAHEILTQRKWDVMLQNIRASRSDGRARA